MHACFTWFGKYCAMLNMTHHPSVWFFSFVSLRAPHFPPCHPVKVSAAHPLDLICQSQPDVLSVVTAREQVGEFSVRYWHHIGSCSNKSSLQRRKRGGENGKNRKNETQAERKPLIQFPRIQRSWAVNFWASVFMTVCRVWVGRLEVITLWIHHISCTEPSPPSLPCGSCVIKPRHWIWEIAFFFGLSSSSWKHWTLFLSVFVFTSHWLFFWSFFTPYLSLSHKYKCRSTRTNTQRRHLFKCNCSCGYCCS